MRKLTTLQGRLVVVAALAAATIGLSSLAAAPSASAAPISCETAQGLAMIANSTGRVLDKLGYDGHAYFVQANMYILMYCSSHSDPGDPQQFDHCTFPRTERCW